jgi:hypothetical protein
MPTNKSAQIDGTTGMPKGLDATDTQNLKYPGMPKDEDLCGITFKPYHTAGGTEENKIDVSGVNFECDPTEECNKKNKETIEQKKKLKDQIDGEQKKIDQAKKDIGDANKILGDSGKKAQHDQAKQAKKTAEGKEEEAKKKKAALEGELGKYPPECQLTYLVAAGGDAQNPRHHVPYDELKKRKVEYVVCLCEKVKAPEPPKK